MDDERHHPSNAKCGRPIVRWAAGLLFAGVALAAHNSGAAQTGVGERPADDLLKQSVIDRVMGAGASFFADIHLDIIDGDALLTGRAATVQDKARATALVRSVPGVQTVTNAIDVGSVNDMPRISDDLLLERKIRKAMLNVFNARMPRVSWRVTNGVVYVFGHAGSEWEHNRTLAVIGQVEGARRVVDYLRLDPNR